MVYHLIIEITENKKTKKIYLINQSNLETIKNCALKYNSNQYFYVDGYRLSFEKIDRFKVVSSEEPLNVIASRIRNDYSRRGIIYALGEKDVLEMEKYITDITASVLNCDSDIVEDGCLNLNKAVEQIVSSKKSIDQQVIINGPVYSGVFTNTQVISGNDNTVTINYQKLNEELDSIEKSIDNEQISDNDKQDLRDIVEDIKECSSSKKKPSIIKNMLKGLKNTLMELGCNITVKLIEDKFNGLY